MAKKWPSVALTIFLILLWQVAAMIISAAYILPSPIQILVKIWDLRKNLFLVQLPATMSVTFIGLLISIVFGLALAVIMDLNKKIANRNRFFCFCNLAKSFPKRKTVFPKNFGCTVFIS